MTLSTQRRRWHWQVGPVQVNIFRLLHTYPSGSHRTVWQIHILRDWR